MPCDEISAGEDGRPPEESTVTSFTVSQPMALIRAAGFVTCNHYY
jgi:hypothetical protein